MKLLPQISSIIVALLFIYTLNFKSFITIDYFFNQTEIIELFCINKEKIQLQCNGKCHLTKELIKADSKKTETPFSDNVNELNIELIIDNNYTKITNTSTTIKNKWFNYSEAIIQVEHFVLTPPPKG